MTAQRKFILGTDTNCGKTETTCYILRQAQQNNQSVLALKPVASGWEQKDGVWYNEDVHRLSSLQSLPNNLDICPWKLPLPIAPHLAAEAVNTSLSAQEILQFCFDKRFDAYEQVFIEGAGGLMVPLNHHETWIDVLVSGQISVILVVGMRLGCINHACLTAEVLKKYKIPCEGWVANCLDPDFLKCEENITTLEHWLDMPLLMRIPYLTHSR
jgi:dethiobiotin synthetase